MIKKRLFIGSSAEKLSLLNQVVSLVGDNAVCIPWTNAFAINKSALDSLIKQTRLSDYAILIATKDDLTKRRGKKTSTPRDNVVLEFGLFLGATSPDRCYLLAEGGAELPSDLNGINICKFAPEAGKYNSLDKVIAEINLELQKDLGVGELGLLPSTALAIGYFNGFIKKVCTDVSKSRCISIDDKKVKVKSLKINVVIPEYLDDDGVENFIDLFNDHHKLTKATTYVDKSKGDNRRGYPFHFKVEPSAIDFDSELDVQISDIPNTIGTIVDALKLYMPSKSVRADEDREFLEKRELANFAKVLKHLISKNSYTKNAVTVEIDVKI